jgi:hypothetical protein
MSTQTGITPARFIAKWRDTELTERAASEVPVADRAVLNACRWDDLIPVLIDGEEPPVREGESPLPGNLSPVPSPIAVIPSEVEGSESNTTQIATEAEPAASSNQPTPVTHNPSPVPSAEEELLARGLTLDLERAGQAVDER